MSVQNWRQQALALRTRSVSAMGIFRQLANLLGVETVLAGPVRDPVEVTLLAPFRIFFVKPVLQPKPVAENVKGGVNFRHTGMTVCE